MSRCELAIIADDLTGACDTALQFHGAGMRAIVALGDAAPGPLGSGGVIALDSDSRGLPPDEAHARVVAAYRRLGEPAPGRLYKKVDSTLRGSVGRELEALCEACGAEAALLAPAFPALGRAVLGGVLLVGGRPLAETPSGAGSPVASSAAAALVGRTARGPVGAVDLAAVRAGGAAVALAAEREIGAGARIVLVDAETDADLAAVAAALDGRPRWLPAGSAGLARALAARMRPPGGAGGAPVRSDIALAAGRPALVVVGSAHPAAREQRGALAAAEGLPTVTLGADASPRAIGRAADALRGALAGSCGAILAAPPAEGALDGPRALAIALALAEAAALAAPLAGGLILTGGDTAAAVMRRLGARGAEIGGEALPGVPMLMLRGGRAEGMVALTKSGGFGGPDYLLLAYRALCGAAR